MGSKRFKYKRWGIGAIAVAATLALVGHWHYWYRPRAHPATPDPKSRTAQIVLAESGADLRIWIPFPHQNLGVLENRLGDLDSVSRAVEDLAGLHPFDLPSFGPFRLPPAYEIVVATDQTGAELVVAARIFPVARWLFRAAGLVANNPWLRGGELTVRDRQVRVHWRGDLWTMATHEVEVAEMKPDVEAGQGLAFLRLGRRFGPVPAGLFRLIRQDGELVVTSELKGESSIWQQGKDPMMNGVAVSWSRFWGTGEDAGLQALVAVDVSPTERTWLPPVLAVQRGSRPLPLPGEQILQAIGVEVYDRNLDGWQLRAYDELPLTLGETLIPYYASLLASATESRLTAVGDLGIDEARRAVRRVGEGLQSVPVLGEAQARRWLALADLLDLFSGYHRMSIRLAEAEELEVRILPRPVD